MATCGGKGCFRKGSRKLLVTKFSAQRIMLLQGGGRAAPQNYITHAEVILMKIVVVRSPKALAPILRFVFKIKKEA